MKDKFTLRALDEGYRARSVYKLIFLNKKYNLIKKNDNVLDLGAWPGSWMQYCLNLEARVTGVDVKQITSMKGGRFILGNIYDAKTLEKIKELGKYDSVLSDLSPKTTGINDQDLSFDLSCKAFEISKEVLKRNGSFVCKIFQSGYLNEFLKELKKSFNFIKSVKPEASKKKSREIYLVCKGYKIQL